MRTILAVGVLLGGVAIALLFRRPSSPADPPAPGVSERLVLRKQGAPSSEAAPGLAAPGTPRDRPARPAETAKKTPAVLTPADPGPSPPSLARTYPRPHPIESSRREPSSGPAPPRAGTPQTTVWTHRIADGDTLQGLAQRYLGRAGRAGEIYEANRDVLSRPDILPIGAELKIHSGTPAAAAAPSPPRRPLVPVPSVP